MKPSSRRMRAISTLIRLAGTETVSWRAPAALRTRVSRSATGSLGIPTDLGRAFFGAAGLRAGRSMVRAASPACSPVPGVIWSTVNAFPLPARFRDTRQLAAERTLAEADPAEAELPHVAAGPATHLAAAVALHLVLGRPSRLQDEALLRHRLPLKTRFGTASRGRGAARGPL